ncbi:glycosyltransferase family 4 protein [Paucibacter sediminis]|uniref:Glycosyltransferase family 4 protein n=1 Tax=Paucibacter sediminis TaxID=3019553 RepID=A0AA95SLB7_9BURK|nr:glycosyltransferase family 4 protein [Paucibacter sp. S2-9]WIT10057.1 glycosyltransferase family 4 protein [Paucibacter sp. S2-9]
MKVAFVFDYVMHYHRATLQAIESRVRDLGGQFTLYTARHAQAGTGRAPLTTAVVGDQRFYTLAEKYVGSYALRHQQGLVEQLEQQRPDIIVTMCHSGTWSEWLIAKNKRKWGSRLLAWQCGYEYNPGLLKRSVLAAFIPRFDMHLCYHSNAKRYAIAHGARPEQTLVMHNTIDEGAIVAGDKLEARRSLEQRHPQLAGKRLVLYVGAVLEEKNLDRVFEALARLKDERNFFLLVGDGPYLATLKQRYAQRSDWLAAGRVVDGVGSYFDAADVFVLPGTGGLAINEAMAHRLAVVSGYADGSADDLVQDGVTGFRLQGDSVEELAHRLGQLLDDPGLARSMGDAGEQRIRGDLSFERFIDRVMQGLLTQAKPARQ